MTKFIETTGKTESEALKTALEQLGLDEDSVSVEVLARAKNGFLGIGSRPAKIRVSYEVADAPEAAPAPETAPVSEAAPASETAPAAEKVPAPEATLASETAPVPETAPAAEKAPEPAAPAPAEEPAEASPAAEIGPDREPQIRAFLTGLLERLELPAEVKIQRSEAGIYQVELVGEKLGGLIGRRGETLDAIQQLTNYSVNRGQPKRVRIHIDAENYRAKREESLQRLARKTAGKALKYRRNMMLEPMNAYERHVIHAALQDYNPAITTYSTGTEPSRRIVVSYRRNHNQ
jgi:spoIIIJ-associated protein